MKTKFYLKPSVLGAAVAAAVAVAGSPAYALEAKLSGQVNRALMNVDDGQTSETFHVDNDNSSTRFRFTGSEDIASGLKAGVVWEVEFQSNDSDQVDQINRGDGAELGERKMEVFLQGAFGKISIGQGDGAANGNVEVDLSGTSVVSYAGTGDIGGGFGFRNSATGAITVNADGEPVNTIRTRLNQQDFESRYDRARYDTPKLGPIVLSVSTGMNGNDDIVELAGDLNLDLGGGGKLAAGVGQSVRKRGGSLREDTTVGGSISWLAPGGLNLTFGTTNKENDPGGAAATTEADFTYFKIGFKSGQHAVSVDFAAGDDQGAKGNEAEHTGIQYVWSPKNWAELYAGYKTVTFDAPGATNFDDLNILLVGSRLKF